MRARWAVATGTAVAVVAAIVIYARVSYSDPAIGVAADGTTHLHFELHDRPMPVGGGYDHDRTGYLDPTAYIRGHRPH